MASIRNVLPPLPATRDLLRTYELKAMKHLSQNFLLDMNVCRKIVKRAGNISDGYVCEVGSGPGSITRAILEQDVRQIDIIEKDSRFMPSLELLKSAVKCKFNIHHADVMKFDFTTIFPDSAKKSWFDSPPNVHFIGNLPFNVSTPLIIQLLRHMINRSGPFSYGRCPLVLTFQKEVAERMVAGIAGRQRCRLSVMCQMAADVKHHFTIPGEAFMPKPEVDVAVVRFVPLEIPLIRLNFDLIEKFCRHFFHYRQKYCVRCIETLFPESIRKKYADELLRRARVSPKAKCTLVSVEEIKDMCIIYYDMCKNVPGLYQYDYRTNDLMLEKLAALENKMPPDYPFMHEDTDHL